MSEASPLARPEETVPSGSLERRAGPGGWTLSERAALAVVVVGLVVFGALLGLIHLSAIQALDEAVIRALRSEADPATPRGPRWLAETARDFTALGGYSVLLTIAGLVSLFLVLERRRSRARFIWVTVLSGYFVSLILKDLVDRPRPGIVPHLSHQHSSSFPSGHSMMSAVVYLTLGLMLSELSVHRRVKVFLVVAPLTIAACVAVSRVAMGVHYPTDVVAGWCAGLCWALSGWLIIRRRRARQTEAVLTSEDAPVRISEDSFA